MFLETVYYLGSDMGTERAIEILRSSNIVLFQLFIFASLGLNISLCAELLLTMRDPFYPAGRRMKFYVIFAIFFATVIPFLTMGRGLSINY